MIHFILDTNFREVDSYQNVFKVFKTNSNLGIRPKNGNGCDSVVVSIEACGALGPGSNPGRGPKGD